MEWLCGRNDEFGMWNVVIGFAACLSKNGRQADEEWKMKNELIQHWIIQIANSDKAQKLNYKHKLKTFKTQHSKHSIFKKLPNAPWKGNSSTAQGIALGIRKLRTMRPVRAALISHSFFTVALTGRMGLFYPFTQGVALGYGEHWAFSPYWLCIMSTTQTQKLNNSKLKNWTTQIAQRALKGQFLHSPGHRPGYKEVTNNAPCKGNSNIPFVFYSCPYR